MIEIHGQVGHGKTMVVILVGIQVLLQLFQKRDRNTEDQEQERHEYNGAGYTMIVRERSGGRRQRQTSAALLPKVDDQANVRDRDDEERQVRVEEGIEPQVHHPVASAMSFVVHRLAIDLVRVLSMVVARAVEEMKVERDQRDDHHARHPQDLAVLDL